MIRRYCMLCGSEKHSLVGCPDGNVKTELSIGEWVLIYLLRRFGQISEAATHYRISRSSMYMALKGSRSLPAQLLRDAGVTVGVKIQGVEP